MSIYYIKFINQKCSVLFHYINDIYNNLNGTIYFNYLRFSWRKLKQKLNWPVKYFKEVFI